MGATGRPTGCSSDVAGKWGSIAACSEHNGGAYRALVQCKYPNGKVWDYEGPWKKKGRSFAYCQGDSKAIGAGFETRVR
jgi:hypothetical protein